MRRIIALVGLGVMVIGLLLVVLGTQLAPSAFFPSAYTTTTPTGGTVYYLTQLQATNSNFTLIGGGLAILGAIAFGFTYPTRRHNPSRAYSTVGF
jgi:uncharacterized membrane protein